jgi:hypothetical protein
MCEDVWILQIMVLVCNSVVHFPSTIELFQTIYSRTSGSILCVLEAIFKNECGHTVILYTLISVQLVASRVMETTLEVHCVHRYNINLPRNMQKPNPNLMCTHTLTLTLTLTLTVSMGNKQTP